MFLFYILFFRGDNGIDFSVKYVREASGEKVVNSKTYHSLGQSDILPCGSFSIERCVHFSWMKGETGVPCVLSKSHIAQRTNECKGVRASVQGNKVKYLLCVQMQETHPIHTLSWLNWPFGEPGQHLHGLPALGPHPCNLTGCYFMPAPCKYKQVWCAVKRLRFPWTFWRCYLK